MLRVALTGNIGSGKSTVCSVLSVMGVPVYNADLNAKKLYDRPEVISRVYQLFGNAIFDVNKLINKAKLAEIIFHDQQKLNQLTSIVYPLVKQDLDRWYSSLPYDCDYAVFESAVTFEGGFDKIAGFVVMVTAPADIRFSRVREREGWQDDVIKAREINQWSEDKKAGLSDFIIVNDDIQPLLPQLFSLNELLKNRKI